MVEHDPWKLNAAVTVHHENKFLPVPLQKETFKTFLNPILHLLVAIRTY